MVILFQKEEQRTNESGILLKYFQNRIEIDLQYFWNISVISIDLE